MVQAFSAVDNRLYFPFSQLIGRAETLQREGGIVKHWQQFAEWCRDNVLGETVTCGVNFGNLETPCSAQFAMGLGEALRQDMEKKKQEEGGKENLFLCVVFVVVRVLLVVGMLFIS